MQLTHTNTIMLCYCHVKKIYNYGKLYKLFLSLSSIPFYLSVRNKLNIYAVLYYQCTILPQVSFLRKKLCNNFKIFKVLRISCIFCVCVSSFWYTCSFLLKIIRHTKIIMAFIYSLILSHVSIEEKYTDTEWHSCLSRMSAHGFYNA